MGWDLKVDLAKCNGDGACKDVCPVDVYEMKDGKAFVAQGDECLGCESCVEACEFDAITLTEN